MHFTVALAFAYILIQLSQQLGLSFYLGWIGALSLFALPVYLFVFLRDAGYLPKGSKYWTVWIGVFVAYPILLLFLKIDVNTLGLTYLNNLDIDGKHSYSYLAMCYIVIELLFKINTENSKEGKESSWLQSNKGMRLTIVIVGLLCLFMLLTNNYLPSILQDSGGFMIALQYIFYFVQLFIIYISYYLYYYVHHHFLYSGLLRDKGFIAYALGIGLVILLVVPIHNYLISFLPVVDDLKLHPMGLVDNLFDDFNYSLAIIVLVFSFPVIVTIEWYKQANTLAELEQAKSKTELDLLRQQINPHFFFNTLNNLYAMSLTQEEDTPDTILQLSELMRYVIYKGKESEVLLSEEIKYINDYIDLEMIRIHKDVDLKFDIDVDNRNIKIPPLLFVILIENAFKHGIAPSGNKSFLYISLENDKGVLKFVCENSLEEKGSNSDKGIGLDNLKKRLSILYPDRHDLILLEDQNTFKASLNIEL